MKNLKTYFAGYKHALDVFSKQLSKSNMIFERDFIKSRSDSIVDTLSTSMVNVKMCMDDLCKSVVDKSEMI